MPASGSIDATDARRSCVRSAATVVCSARTRITSARRSRRVSFRADGASSPVTQRRAGFASAPQARGSCDAGRSSDQGTTTSPLCRVPYAYTSNPGRTHIRGYAGCGFAEEASAPRCLRGLGDSPDETAYAIDRSESGTAHESEKIRRRAGSAGVAADNSHRSLVSTSRRPASGAPARSAS